MNVVYVLLLICKLFHWCDNSWSNVCRAVRAMSETLKQNRLQREQVAVDSSLFHSPNDRAGSMDLHKKVCLHYFCNNTVCYYL